MDTLTEAEYARRYVEVARRYRLRARLPVFRRRVERARRLIGDALARGRASVGFSGGKDSLVVADLAREIASSISLHWIDCGAETPATLEVMRRVEALGWTIERVETVYPLYEMLRMTGLYGYTGPGRIPDHYWPDRAWGHVLVDEPVARLRAEGYEVQVLGLRREENRGRRISLAKYGALHQRKDGLWIAAPLADWTGSDVLTYATVRGLPLSEIYLDPDDPDRERRRTGPAIGAEGDTWGRFQDLRRRHPAFWQRLTTEFPGLGELG